MSGRIGKHGAVGVALWTVALGIACGTDDDTVPVQEGTSPAIVQSMLAARVDCPDHSVVKIFEPGGDSTLFTTLSVPQAITLVPEFHDCQRLLIDAATGYGPLVGVFASNDLGGSQTNRLPVAEIVNFDPVDYEPLGIKPNFNCLYMFTDETATNGIAAFMVPVDTAETKCTKPYDTTMKGTPLLVKPYTPPSPLNWEDIPKVARWEWNNGTRTQYIGIKCDLQWCEVGPSGGFTLSGDHKYPFDKKREKRTFWIKGWYDEQRLAVKVGNILKPHAAVGTIVPDSALGDYTDATFPVKKWVPAARVAIHPHAPEYKKKLGLDHVPPANMPGKMNYLELCFSTWADCASVSNDTPTQPTTNCTASTNNWWARMQGAQGGYKYFCVLRTAHTHPIEGTARWRWNRRDETIWIRCAEGCCQVNSDET